MGTWGARERGYGVGPIKGSYNHVIGFTIEEMRYGA